MEGIITKIAILGYVGRGRNYALLCKNVANKNYFEIVAVIDVSSDKLNLAKKELGLADDKLFKSIDDFCSIFNFICYDVMFVGL